MMRTFSTILVTGGAGFIGTNFIHYLFGSGGFDGRVVNLDALTYEGLFSKYEIDAVVHFAARSHVDRSIRGPEAFIKTDVIGTYTMMNVARKAWAGSDDVLGETGPSARTRPTVRCDPRRMYD